MSGGVVWLSCYSVVKMFPDLFVGKQHCESCHYDEDEGYDTSMQEIEPYPDEVPQLTVDACCTLRDAIVEQLARPNIKKHVIKWAVAHGAERNLPRRRVRFVGWKASSNE